MGLAQLEATEAAIGASSFLKEALTATTVLVKGAAGNLYDLHVENATGAKIYVQLFDAATAGGVTVGTTAPLRSYCVEANSTLTLPFGAAPVRFTAGLVLACTTTATGNSTATAALVIMGYK